MSSFPSEYYIILSLVFLIPIIIIGILFITSKISKKDIMGLEPKNNCYCPTCRFNLQDLANERAKMTGGTSIRIVCPDCQAPSDWNVSGFPFVHVPEVSDKTKSARA